MHNSGMFWTLLGDARDSKVCNFWLVCHFVGKRKRRHKVGVLPHFHLCVPCLEREIGEGLKE